MKITYEAKTLDDGIGFLSHTEDGCPMLSTFKIKYLLPKIGVSLCSGCGVKCIYCFTNGYQRFRPLTVPEITGQVEMVMNHCKRFELMKYIGGFRVDKGFAVPQQPIKISFKQMGDPLLNPGNTIGAIIDLLSMYPRVEGTKKPYATFVVSTSAPKTKRNKKFFDDLNDLNCDITLQFSLHTTSDKERDKLCPAMPMMSLEEIAKVANASRHPVTLNFVMFDGYEYSAKKIKDLFRPFEAFIKINYIDRNTYTDANNLKDLALDKTQKFIDQLKHHFNMAWRD